jgi:hypothetical protein
MTRRQKKVVTQAEHLFGATCAILFVLAWILPISQRNFGPFGRGQSAIFGALIARAALNEFFTLWQACRNGLTAGCVRHTK